MLRALTLPGAEYVIPLLFPRFVRRGGDKLMRFFHDRGVRAPHFAEMWSAYASLTETPNRHAFIRTLRAVIDPGGQTVSARDRLYLAAAVPTLIAWGDRDDIIPIAHAYAAHELHAGQPARDLRRRGPLPPRRRSRPLRGDAARIRASTAAAHRDTATFRETLLAQAELMREYHSPRAGSRRAREPVQLAQRAPVATASRDAARRSPRRRRCRAPGRVDTHDQIEVELRERDALARSKWTRRGDATVRIARPARRDRSQVAATRRPTVAGPRTGARISQRAAPIPSREPRARFEIRDHHAARRGPTHA